MNQDRVDVMQSNDENSLVVLHLNNRLDDYIKQNHELQAKIDSTTELIDWYVEDCEEHEYQEATKYLRMLQEDVWRTIE